MIESALAEDRSVHLVHRADPHELLTIVQRWHLTGLYAIPGVWQRILDEGADYDASSLREVLTGTSLVALELVDALKARFPVRGRRSRTARPRSGAARCSSTATSTRVRAASGSRHRWSPSTSTRAASSSSGGRPCSVATPDRPDATAEAIDEDGWFHTGDLASRDADGFLTITGRRSESIRSGGEWVAPVEVETAILTHPAVVEVGVVGLPDPSWGEVVCAAIVVQPGCDAADGRSPAGARRVDARRPEAAARRGRGREAPAHRCDRPDPSGSPA